MRQLDVTSNGVVSKDDFINTVFDNVRGVKPSDLMQLVTAFTEADGDQDVKYEEFLHLISRNGEVDGLENHFRQMSAEKTDLMTYGARPSERSMRDTIEKVKIGVGQANGGIMGVEQALRKVGSNGGQVISMDDLIIGLSRVNARLSLDEIKEFFKIAKGGKDAEEGDSI